MKVTTIALFLIVFVSTAYSQSSSDTSYFDENWNLIAKEKASFFRVITHEEKRHKLTDYYMSGIKQMEGSCMLPNGYIFTGKFIYYNKEGLKTKEGNYVGDRQDGIWVQYRNDTNKEIVWYTETYVKGVQKGELSSYYPNGVIKSKEYIVNLDSSTGKTYNEQGVEVHYSPFMTLPKFNGNLMKYYAENMHYPEHCINNNIEGVVKVELLVAEDGTLFGVHVRQKAHPLLDAEALRLVKNMPKWLPGKLDGKNAQFYFTQPITFRLED